MKYRIQIFLLTIGIIHFSCSDEELKISDEFKGSWEWYSSCGGIAGCSYAKDRPNESQFKLIIDESSIQTIQNNGSITTVHYQVKSTTTQDNLRIYEIELEDGTQYSAAIVDNFLTTHDGIGWLFSASYKRLK